MIEVLSEFPFPVAAIVSKWTNYFQIVDFSPDKTIRKILHDRMSIHIIIMTMVGVCACIN
jgi:hypothetical protein